MLDTLNTAANLILTLIICGYFLKLLVTKLNAQVLKEKPYDQSVIIMMMILGATLSSTKVIDNGYLEIVFVLVGACLGWLVVKYVKKRDRE